MAIVLAGGQGKRMQSKIQKQYMELKGYPVLYYSLKEFEESDVDGVVLVVGKGEISYCQKEIIEKYGFQKVVAIVEGGKERYESVYYGLKAIESGDYVLIHDGARPLLTQAIIKDSIEGVKKHRACVVGMPVKDTIKVIDKEGFAKETPDRSTLWLMQTPQSFTVPLVTKAYEEMMKVEDNTITDDAMVVEKYGNHPIKLLKGSYENIKITTPEDLMVAECLLSMRMR